MRSPKPVILLTAVEPLPEYSADALAVNPALGRQLVTRFTFDRAFTKDESKPGVLVGEGETGGEGR
jgi:hypothetical protein